MIRQQLSAWLVALSLCACSAEGAVPPATRDSNDAPAQPAVGACAPTNLTQTCSCSTGLRGRQVCLESAWSQCECRATTTTNANAGSNATANAGSGSPGASANSGAAQPGLAADPADNRSIARFDWQRTVPTGGSCEAGHYEGTFSGIYGPSIIVVANLKVIPVFPIDLPGSPGLAFDLTREGSGEVFAVSNGKMNGNALGAFPFTADIVGKLDCSTLKFDARLVNGSYFIGPLEYMFEGPIIADYDKLTHTLVNGTWVVEEPAWPGAGGMGDWTVQFIHN